MQRARRCRSLHAARVQARAQPALLAQSCRPEIPSSRRTPCRWVAAPAGSGRRAAGSPPQQPRSLFGVPSRPIACELIGDAAAARAALQRPLQGLLARRVGKLGAESPEPVTDDLEVLVLVER